MMNKRINTLLWIGVFGTLVLGPSLLTDLYQAFWGDRTIWWTHQSMKLPIEKTRNHFELYIRGEPFRKHLVHGTLFSVDKNGKQHPVLSQEVTVRLNNVDKVRASILERTTLSAFALGIAATLLVIGLIQVFQDRKKSGPESLHGSSVQ